MAKGFLFLDDGSKREGKTRYRAYGATRAADVLDVFPGDTLASLTERAYGANTPELREKIQRANANLKGTINVPR